MQFENELAIGTLLKRYKRFLADVMLKDGKLVTAHVPNTGSMKSTNEPGSDVALSYHPDPKRKLKWTLELVRAEGGAWVGVNTMKPNGIVEEAILSKEIPGLKRFINLRREVPYGKNSRVDLLLEGGKRNTYIEVKNVTYKLGDKALFPDAVTARGTKHLLELANVVTTGHRGVIFFLVNRGDCLSMSPAWEIDPTYSRTLHEVSKRGVRVMAYQSVIDTKGIRLGEKIRVVLEQ